MNKLINGVLVPLTQEEIAQLEIDKQNALVEQAKQEKLELISQHEQYLSSTDWYIIRSQEIGTLIPKDILDARQLARDEISRLRDA